MTLREGNLGIMKIYSILDEIDWAVGLKLAGISSIVLNEKEKIESHIDEVLKQEDVGILVVSKQVYTQSKQKLDEIKEKRKTPLIVVI